MYSHHSDKGTNVAGTPKFKENDILLEVDGWCLVRPLYPDLLRISSYIVHMNCRREEPRSVHSVGVRARVGKQCTFCGEMPPDEIAGLEILHNGKI